MGKPGDSDDERDRGRRAGGKDMKKDPVKKDLKDKAPPPKDRGRKKHKGSSSSSSSGGRSPAKKAPAKPAPTPAAKPAIDVAEADLGAAAAKNYPVMVSGGGRFPPPSMMGLYNVGGELLALHTVRVQWPLISEVPVAVSQFSNTPMSNPPLMAPSKMLPSSGVASMPPGMGGGGGGAPGTFTPMPMLQQHKANMFQDATTKHQEVLRAGKTPCFNFMGGRCFRQNCRFAHIGTGNQAAMPGGGLPPQAQGFTGGGFS
eukprot:gnl/TRDRNA2_/TRDRNA2_80317_c0_seq2.p1 gnl/TRDRNA2_/TRDRNA2_80317_c0~~gnl/TRDRNA2_/TRDRNA2_80317_c0_seq2.p1  ORF type:complete len:258 (-),score=66.97 gnl/TRDRNA2_/TRDRNA2_80317_c0_seq2:160-933(-)